MSEIINTYDQLRAAGGGIAICYQRQDLGRGGSPAKFRVLHVAANGKEMATNTKAQWYDYGAKTFIVGRPIVENKPKQLIAAVDWVDKTYGESGPWVRNRRGDYVPKRINDQFPLRKRKSPK